MDIIFLSPRHSLVDLLQHLFIKPAQAVVDNPHPVIHGQADKIKPQRGNPGKITLPERFVAPILRKLVEQVKPTPVGERLVGSFRKTGRHRTGGLNLPKKGPNKANQEKQKEDTCIPKMYTLAVLTPQACTPKE